MNRSIALLKSAGFRLVGVFHGEQRLQVEYIMLMPVRHLLAILLLPFLAVVGVPYGLLISFSAWDTRWGDISQILWLPRLAGAAFIISSAVVIDAGVGIFQVIADSLWIDTQPRWVLVSGPDAVGVLPSSTTFSSLSLNPH
jgi:hypothetical protein